MMQHSSIRFLACGAFAWGLAAVPAGAAPLQWAQNGHYYELVAGDFSFHDALAAAAARSHEGLAGHLATVTTAAEWAFLDTILNPAGVTAWLGGSDAAAEGTWEWVAGPEAGLAFWQGDPSGAARNGLFAGWNPGEPNNLNDEDYLLGWYGAGWNDIGIDDRRAMLVEYSIPAAVPLPAGVILLAGGLGALVLLRRRG
ncbi:VPLPA-CTERM sorting domain-containing protein [Mangrovicoccus algicola]|uniref:VPLPA-CTERM sorting domain-containing protein n=1 Tax=Mangrovicoccus algicola TaxID=2771008 RepID=A0A8J6YSU2_9RHOB|nr:VPLPA-CTERM sorting domain-containing protein [Mangrovicoccus algicola]MBE3636940.1 VPLPA-CTERM sorting domain-containing protein [Mangrovicoccus algicola]